MRRTWLIALFVGAVAANGCGDDATFGVDGGFPADSGGGMLDAGPMHDGGTRADAGAPTCPTPSGPTTHTSSVPSDETWTAEASPHIVPSGATVNFGATLTIEACAEVRIGAGQTITVRGDLVANGTAEQPVLIHSDGAGPFAQIRNYAGASSIRLTHTTVAEGGDPLTTAPYLTAAIYMQGDPTMPTQGLLHVDHVTVRGSMSNGILVLDGAGFSTGSTELTVEGSAAHPVSMWVPALDTLPVGTYTGNAIDEIVVPGGGGAQSVVRDMTIHDRGVPYRIGTPSSTPEIIVDTGVAGTFATLTIEPGVTLRFLEDGALWIERFVGVPASEGALVAVGTPGNEIIFTSAADTPAAGDWLGIYFGSTPRSTSRLDYVRVEYAGRSTGFGSSSCGYTGQPNNDGAVRFTSGDPPTQLLTNSTISDSANHGIDRGWEGAPVDFTPTNAFTGVARCRQTLPHLVGMPCPASVPCD